MLVRTATSDDRDAIAALHAHSWRRTYRHILDHRYLDHEVDDDRHDLWAARFVRLDRSKHHVAVATPDTAGSLLGFVCVLLDEEPEYGALLDNLHVAPDRHGQGIGRRLMADAAGWCASREPAWPMHLWVYEDNARTVHFYRLLGGAEVDRRVIVTPAGNRAAVLRFEWADTAALAARLTTSLDAG